MKLKILKYTGFLVVVFGIYSFSKSYFTPIYFEVPKNFPKPVYDFSKNPLTEEKFQLGRTLFYDPILSRDNTISCASCHLQASAFTHIDHDLSHGIDGRIGTRNSLTLQNLAWSKDFMWDGGINHLDVQPITPITSAFEMDEILPNVIQKLQNSPKYNALFIKAYGDAKVNTERLTKSLSQFLVQLVSANSKYDKVMRQEETFTPQEQNGYTLFKNNCTSCHTEPLFTTEKFETNGLPVDDYLKDAGRSKITTLPKDSLLFKVPTLRNIQFSFPYMHDGRFKTLNEVVLFYNTNPNAKALLFKKNNRAMNLSDNERVDLIAFLKTLSDKEFLFNPRYSFPKE
ncbi:cytochrome-c peroxidase [Flavobacterium capsici]|uniref:Cytochrome c peroxidase n=1 Tax=Flavobacterium capsici TaxID=3075618 RepID=A0AA96ETY0_9FLAO|nr:MULTISPECIES: cytochrome c peroxidase [unclassified Flavobacterium]WNM18186.1 cytochrome c peroxidase [Flavobacterium sp. PMR2A8]WNM22237.1 cytochrome c peroxidase [Flavobacterium sp. PMTSA4]